MARKKILVVDDSRTAMMMNKMILAKHPFTIVTACNGREGVEKALAELPDLILMDVVMPEMNGFDALRAIRDKAETKDTPVIMVTTRSEAENVEVGYEIGCNDYITKPVNGPELIEKIRGLIDLA